MLGQATNDSELNRKRLQESSAIPSFLTSRYVQVSPWSWSKKPDKDQPANPRKPPKVDTVPAEYVVRFLLWDPWSSPARSCSRLPDLKLLPSRFGICILNRQPVTVGSTPFITPQALSYHQSSSMSDLCWLCQQNSAAIVRAATNLRRAQPIIWLMYN